jgi:UDP-glucose 4-epimerase
MKKIGVIGANGYIGKHIVSYLQRYYDVNVNVDSYDIVAECDLPNYHQVNLTDKESIKGLNLDLDYIFMFAGLTGTYNGFNEYEKFISINELGLLNLLDAIKNSEYRPKVIFPSTRLVYKGVDKSLKEDDLKECKTIYAANKLACEGYLQAYHDSFDIPYTIFRICLPYGNLLSTDYSFGTVGFFIRQAKAGKDITLYGGGNIKRTFTHMEDLCYQIIEGSFHHESNGQTYNVGGETLSLHDAAEIIAAKYGTKVTEIPWPERDLRIESSHTYFDDTKIRSLLRNMNPYKKLSDFTNDL